MTTKAADTHNPMPADQPLALRLSEGLDLIGADDELLARLLDEKQAVQARLAELQSEINATRLRLSEQRTRLRDAAKRPNKLPRLFNQRNIAMTLAAIEGAELAEIGRNFGVSSMRVRQVIDHTLRRTMHPSRWGFTDAPEHPRTISRARLQKEPLVSVLRKMLNEV